MVFKMQYISDIHLEFRKEIINIKPIKGIKNLALCGDIGYPSDDIYMQFIKKCSSLFENVFVIFGNHEYYTLKVPAETMKEIKKHTEKFPSNVYFMDNNCLYIEKKSNKVFKNFPENGLSKDYIKIIGSTLWTNIKYETSIFMNDYKHIYIKKIDDYIFKLTWDKVVEMHKKSVKYILDELDKNKSIDCILLTHHSPHTIGLGSTRNSILMSGYATDIPKLYTKKNLKVCVFGHTHESLDTVINFKDTTIRFVANQYGYPHEKKSDLKYDEMAFIELK